MRTSSAAKAILSGFIGIAIGVVFVAVANLVNPVGNLTQSLIIVCVPAFVSALVGNTMGSRRDKPA
jgi:hypothetical protein